MKTIVTPATKAQLDELIALTLRAGFNEAAGLLKLGSETLSEQLRAQEAIEKIEADLQEARDNWEEVGEISHRTATNAAQTLQSLEKITGVKPTRRAFSDEEIRADYQERNDLYNEGMGR